MILCRVLPHRVEDGSTNMATDEALLDSVARYPEAAVVRTYGWRVPTLSLGYFQNYAAVASDPRWANQAIVRRATGGGALWHDREVTYAVVIPASHPLARPSTALYQAIHEAISSELNRQGVSARRRGIDRSSARSSDDRPFLCFQDHDADDVVVGQVKLVGSAQRRRAGAVLQHGSLLLARSPTTPELPGLSEQIAMGRTQADPLLPENLATIWQKILAEILPRLIGTESSVGDFTEWERERADTLDKTYQDRAWTQRR